MAYGGLAMKKIEPYWLHCHPEAIAMAMYPHLLKMYHVSARSAVAAALHDHVKKTFERHWRIYQLSLQPKLWNPPHCESLDREHEPWEEYLLRRTNLWEGRLTIARLMGYDEEEDFIRFINRDFRYSLWQTIWRTRPKKIERTRR